MTEQIPPQNPLQAALAAVTGLSERVTKLTGEVVNLRRYGRRNRRYIFIDVALTVVIAAVSWVAFDASATADQNGVTIAQLHATQVSGCLAGNQTRVQEIKLWEHLAKIASPAPHLTKAQIAANKREVAALLAYIRMTFQPRDCAALYRLPGGSS